MLNSDAPEKMAKYPHIGCLVLFCQTMGWTLDFDSSGQAIIRTGYYPDDEGVLQNTPQYLEGLNEK